MKNSLKNKKFTDKLKGKESRFEENWTKQKDRRHLRKQDEVDEIEDNPMMEQQDSDMNVIKKYIDFNMDKQKMSNLKFENKLNTVPKTPYFQLGNKLDLTKLQGERFGNPGQIDPRRNFNKQQKKECWNLARTIEHRDKDRWRIDRLGNYLFRHATALSCVGPICLQYDHIWPHSLGGNTSTNNCQILQAPYNMEKSNLSHTEPIYDMHLTDEAMNLIEMMWLGNVHYDGDEYILLSDGSFKYVGQF